jgi:hypothetical protein
MQAHAIDAGAAWAAYERRLLRVDTFADSEEASSGSLRHGRAAANRGGIDVGEKALVVAKWIGVGWIRVRGEAAPNEQTAKTAHDVPRDMLDFRVLRRSKTPKPALAVLVGDVDAVENQ